MFLKSLFEDNNDKGGNDSPYYSSSTNPYDPWYATDGSTYGGSFSSSSNNNNDNEDKEK